MTTFLNNPTVGQTKEITVASTTQSVEFINLTHFAVAMSGTMAGQIVTLQPFQSKVCKVNRGETLEFETKAPVVATPQQNSEYVEIYESTLANDGGITPLAMVPVYTSNVQLTGTNSVTVDGGTVTADISGTVDVAGSVNVGNSVTVGSISSPVTVEGNIGLAAGATVNANIQGTPTFDIASGANVGISGGTVDINTGSVEVTNAVQTNALVKLGTATFNISDLANNASVSVMLAGVSTGYWNTLIAEGTSKNGYTYNLAMDAYNRSVKVGTPSLTQDTGTGGEFYSSGTMSAKQSFSNVNATLTAEVTAASTIFNDPITSNAGWKVDTGAATFGANGATFTQNGTVIEETTQTALAPQNLTLRGQFAVQNTQVTNSPNSNVGQQPISNHCATSNNNSFNFTSGYSYGSSFTVNTQTVLTSLSVYTTTSGYPFNIYLMDNSGNILASVTGLTSSSNILVTGSLSSPYTLQSGTTYWIVVSATTNAIGFGAGTTSPSTTAGVTFTQGISIYYKSGVGVFPSGGSLLTSAYALVVQFTFNTYAPYDTSGNGGRKIGVLSNGWIVTSGKDSNNYPTIFVSKDNGSSEQIAGYVSYNANEGFAIVTYGNKVFVLCANSGGSVNLYGTDLSTFAFGSSSQIPLISGVDSGQSSIGSGCSLAVDSSGNLYAVWCSKNSTYPNSFNIRYSKSTNGGSTWATVTQVTSINTSGSDFTNPNVVIQSNGNPFLVWQQIQSSGTQGIVYSSWNGSTWSTYTFVYSSATYQQTNPSVCVDHNGTILVTWQGEDSTYTSNPQIKFTSSTNGGSTWSTAQTLTSSTGTAFTGATITVDLSNKIYILFKSSYDNSIGEFSSTNAGSSWTFSTFASGDNYSNPQTLYPTTLNFSSPLTLLMDNTTNYTKFMGSWIVGSHSTVSTHYRQDANDYYKAEWNAGYLNLIKVSGGTQTTLAQTLTNETATSVTLSLVVASNGNLTATLSGNSSTQATASDTAITSGVLALAGDSNVVASNAFISGNYVPSDVVNVDIYATVA